MDKQRIKQKTSSVDKARRKLLKIGVYSAPAVLFLGKVSGARASSNGRPIESKDRGKGCGFFEKIVTLGLCD
ncbi:MAG TPA: hypothetical protein VLB01_04095 [Thermodesulfobacteriota bacterium]|nr:hypothetical protein [Thermodesulfobacteriota bacterium]